MQAADGGAVRAVRQPLWPRAGHLLAWLHRRPQRSEWWVGWFQKQVGGRARPTNPCAPASGAWIAGWVLLQAGKPALRTSPSKPLLTAHLTGGKCAAHGSLSHRRRDSAAALPAAQLGSAPARASTSGAAASAGGRSSWGCRGRGSRGSGGSGGAGGGRTTATVHACAARSAGISVHACAARSDPASPLLGCNPCESNVRVVACEKRMPANGGERAALTVLHG